MLGTIDNSGAFEMELITCHCSHCGNGIEFDRDYDGLEIDCPHCTHKTFLLDPSSPPPPQLPALAPPPPSNLINCPDCGRNISKRAATCPACGAPVLPPRPAPPVYQMPLRSRGIYIILGLFLGALGIHNFYAGRNSAGAAQLLLTVFTGWLVFPLVCVLLWSLLEVCIVTRDGRGIPLA